MSLLDDLPFEDKWCTVKWARQQLAGRGGKAVARQTIYYYLNQGKFPGARQIKGQAILLPVDEVLALSQSKDKPVQKAPVNDVFGRFDEDMDSLLDEMDEGEDL